jgi:leader peptidase (prepilin peptidase)/N-methyltransferase
MEQFIISLGLVLLGLCMGSFAGASVWRLRAKQLIEDKTAGEEVDKAEYKKLLPLTKNKLANDRSRCLHCGHTLAWYDLVPLVSWLSTGGKCRYCKQKIGWFEPLMEVGMATVFIGLYLLWPYQPWNALSVAYFATWLIASVLLGILFAYDLKWFLLPNKIVFPLIGVAAVSAILYVLMVGGNVESILSIAVAMVILSGLYLALWFASKGKWIGFGDVKLGLALALLLANWELAFVALFAANFIGCLIVIPGMLSKKITVKTRVPFGPLLIVGTLVAFLFGAPVVNWYMSSLL